MEKYRSLALASCSSHLTRRVQGLGLAVRYDLVHSSGEGQSAGFADTWFHQPISSGGST